MSAPGVDADRETQGHIDRARELLDRCKPYMTSPQLRETWLVLDETNAALSRTAAQHQAALRGIAGRLPDALEPHQR